MEVLKRLPLLLAALLLGGCELLREPTPLEFTDDQVLVASLLESGSPTVGLLLMRLRPGGMPGRFDPSDVVRPISGATVLIFSGADTVQLREGAPEVRQCFAASLFPEDMPATPGCYGALVAGGVRAGARYGLLIRLPGGGEVRGEAVVPDTLTLLQPQANSRYEIRTSEALPQMTVQWEGTARGVAEVRVGFQQVTVFEDGRRGPESRCSLPEAWPIDPLRPSDTIRADSISILLGPVFCRELIRSGGQPQLGREIRWDSIHVPLAVTAYDSAYVRYHSLVPNEAIEYRDAAVGLSGAIGIFAASSVTRRPVALIAGRATEP